MIIIPKLVVLDFTKIERTDGVVKVKPFQKKKSRNALSKDEPDLSKSANKATSGSSSQKQAKTRDGAAAMDTDDDALDFEMLQQAAVVRKRVRDTDSDKTDVSSVRIGTESTVPPAARKRPEVKDGVAQPQKKSRVDQTTTAHASEPHSGANDAPTGGAAGSSADTGRKRKRDSASTHTKAVAPAEDDTITVHPDDSSPSEKKVSAKRVRNVVADQHDSPVDSREQLSNQEPDGHSKATEEAEDDVSALLRRAEKNSKQKKSSSVTSKYADCLCFRGYVLAIACTYVVCSIRSEARKHGILGVSVVKKTPTTFDVCWPLRSLCVCIGVQR